MVKTSPYGDRMVGNMLYSCVAEKKRGHEQFVAEHSLGFILAGEVHFETPVGMYIGKTGTMGLARKNQLIKSWKVPGEDGTFKAINITFDQDILRRHSAEKNITATGKYTGAPFVPFEQNPFLKGFFDSLAPYFDVPGRLTEPMVQIKTNEAIELLLQSNPQLADLLFDFSEPYKIDLESFMEQHYMYNVTASHFAKLTGRSLAGFKRDFEKIFNISPGSWLKQKRLSEAYYLIKEKGRKPSDVYLEVGFENLSHFSFAFKKTYGVAPSLV